MRRLRRRTIIALVLAGALAAGVLFFCFQLIGKGNDWVGFFGTRYYDSGAIYDRNGVLLYDGQTKSYAENQATRVSTLHLVGDQNFGTSLRSVLASRLTGYNLVTGTSLGSHDVTLTIDAAINAQAYAALNARKGVVAVYDYTTGDLLCEVSSPSYDPNNPPSDINENPAYEGVYLNRFFSSTYPPGSVFKLVTTAAALEPQKAKLEQEQLPEHQAAPRNRKPPMIRRKMDVVQPQRRAHLQIVFCRLAADNVNPHVLVKRTGGVHQDVEALSVDKLADGQYHPLFRDAQFLFQRLLFIGGGNGREG